MGTARQASELKDLLDQVLKGNYQRTASNPRVFADLRLSPTHCRHGCFHPRASDARAAQPIAHRRRTDALHAGLTQRLNQAPRSPSPTPHAPHPILHAPRPTPHAPHLPCSGRRLVAGCDRLCPGQRDDDCLQPVGHGHEPVVSDAFGSGADGNLAGLKVFLSYSNYANLGVSKGATRDFTVARGRGDMEALGTA